MAESGTRLDQPPGDPDANRRAPAPRAEAPHGPGPGATGYHGAPRAAPGGVGASTDGTRPKGPSRRLRWLFFAVVILAAVALVWFLIARPDRPGSGHEGAAVGGPAWCYTSSRSTGCNARWYVG